MTGGRSMANITLAELTGQEPRRIEEAPSLRHQQIDPLQLSRMITGSTITHAEPAEKDGLSLFFIGKDRRQYVATVYTGEIEQSAQK